MIGLSLLLACTPEGRFPIDFQWGTATAGFQVDPGCPTWSPAECEDPHSDWYQWVTDPDLIAEASLHLSGEPLADGPGMWETFDDDVALMKSDHLDALRLGLEWSRVFPDGAAEGATTVDELYATADMDAVARYHAMFATLDEAGIRPLVTVNHYTLPLWVHDGKDCHYNPDTCANDGWVDRERILRLIGLWAGFCGREFGGEVDTWATLNEPMAVVLSGYLTPGPDRTNPPGLAFDAVRGKAVLQNQVLAHGVMVDALRAQDTVDVDDDGKATFIGLVMNMADMVPKDPTNADDIVGVEHIDHLYHRLFLDGAVSGSWDDDLDGVFETTKPELVDHLDWVGVNYYAVVTVTGLGTTLPGMSDIPIATFYPEIGWYPTPEGFGHVLDRAAEYQLPVIVTENGWSNPSDEGARADLLAESLRVVQGRIDDGRDIRGYYPWSWVDNYEWNHGMTAFHFGLYGLEPGTKARVERPIAVRYREIAGDRGFRD